MFNFDHDSSIEWMRCKVTLSEMLAGPGTMSTWSVSSRDLGKSVKARKTTSSSLLWMTCFIHMSDRFLFYRMKYTQKCWTIEFEIKKKRLYQSCVFGFFLWFTLNTTSGSGSAIEDFDESIHTSSRLHLHIEAKDFAIKAYEVWRHD